MRNSIDEKKTDQNIYCTQKVYNDIYKYKYTVCGVYSILYQ